MPGRWPDTHVRLEGPAVMGAQVAFMEDWYWSAGTVPELHWDLQRAADGDMDVLVMPSGPADGHETCSLMFLELIQSARHRFWISSPYFVPDESVLHALTLAAMRGVDVRILLPIRPDHRMVYLASFSCLQQLDLTGIGIYRYEPGFLHQKVALVDDSLAMVGTANLDNRSMRLNFEVSVLVADREFAAQVEQMLAEDLAFSRHISADEYVRREWPFKVGVHLARLLSPVL